MVPCMRENAIRDQWDAGSSPASVQGLDILV